MLLVSIFLPQRGIRRILHDINEIQLPIMRFSRAKDQVKRHWFCTALSMRHCAIRLNAILNSDVEHDFYSSSTKGSNTQSNENEGSSDITDRKTSTEIK